MTSFCGDGKEGLVPLFTASGISPCFVESFMPVLATGFLLLATLRLLTPTYKPIPNSDKRTLLKHIVLCVMYVSGAFAATVIRIVSHQLYPYHIIELVLTIPALLINLFILKKDQNYLRDHNLFQFLFWTVLVSVKFTALASVSNPDWQFRALARPVRMAFHMCYIIQFLSMLLILYIGFITSKKRRHLNHFMLSLENRHREDTSNLLDPNDTINGQQNYSEAELGKMEKEARKNGEFWESAIIRYSRRTRSLAPYVWPSGSFLAQASIGGCVILLLAGRVVNILLPLYYKNIINALNEQHQFMSINNNTYNTSSHVDVGSNQGMPIKELGIYVLLMALQGGGSSSNGVLGNLRSLLWINVQQHTCKSLKMRLFSHIHRLSLDWHLKKKTGEVIRVMDRGTDSISSLLSVVLFNIIPTMLDITAAIVFFVFAFDAIFGIIVFSTMLIYMVLTIIMTEWRTQFRKAMNQKDKLAYGVSVDSLMNYETVKYFTAEEYEAAKYDRYLSDFQTDEWQSLSSLNLLNTMQNITIQMGLLSGILMCCYRILQGFLSPGDFVLFIAYIMQLYQPLNWFGSYWRSIQQSFVDMENMFDLLDLDPSVFDSPNAYTIPPNMPVDTTNLHQDQHMDPNKDEMSTAAEIVFDHVSFSYGDREVLKDISFTVPKGQTYALVGMSGGGKTTTLRLLLRFYDPQLGKITINGHDIKNITQKSLRSMIGVVPQDTVLFNDSIFYNIQYGRQGSSDSDVKEAARAAEIEHRILQFPQQYDTIVGERGLRLSGGEKQRVAIARVMLKAPPIVVLDEATSALDSETERNIQASLDAACTNRTTLVIAHRLSTIIKADKLLVFQNGSIVEQGTFEQLVNAQGVFHTMWNLQLFEHQAELQDIKQ